MSTKPIFVATHPRACSTAFERVFMTRPDLQCIHEPFGDAFYYGPERLSSRFEIDSNARVDSGFSESTYQTIFDRIAEEGAEGKRLFIKDIAYYLLPPDGAPPSIAPSLARKKSGVGTSQPSANGASSEVNGASPPFPYRTDAELGNPTVIPNEVLKQFHFTFLIRHPKSSIPSYFRCTVPPLDKMTGFFDFMPSEAGYSELRRFFDHLCSTGQVGPKGATQEKATRPVNGSVRAPTGVNDHSKGVDICVIDADDLLDNPAGTIQAYCDSVGLDYSPSMLKWDRNKDHEQACTAFEKWKGFHEDAIGSKDLKPRAQKKKVKSREDEDEEWREKFGAKGAKVIRETVDANVEDYEYLKQFAFKV